MCAELVSFEERRCPSCGHYEPLAGLADPGPSQACVGCSESILADLHFCPHCGREQQPLAEGAAQSEGRVTGAAPRRLVLGVLAATVVGPLALAAALVAVFA